jgi:osmotically-inducible protein OsmY
MGWQPGESAGTVEFPTTKGKVGAGLRETCVDRVVVHEAQDALQWNVVIPRGRVTVTVANGWLTLKGVLDWRYQKDAAVRAVRHLAGVKGVTNRIILRSDLSGAIR